MKGREIFSKIEQLKTAEHRFVKWWRKENDFLDYDLINRYLDNLGSSEEIEGFDLLTLDEMWDEVMRVCGSRVRLERDRKGDLVEWTHSGANGTKTEVCVYTPETVMKIYDVETKGNPVGP
jgi:hypothetical protein